MIHRRFLPAGLLFILLPGAMSALDDPTPLLIGVPEIDDGAVATWRALTWEDFNGEIGRFRREAAGILAQVFVDQVAFDFEPSGPDGEVTARLQRLRVYAAMNRLESKYKAGSRSEWTLAHEQGHFDITEVCARRLRGELSTAELSARADTEELAGQALAQQIERLYRQSVTSCDQLQSRYDGETVHGTKKSRQKKWWQTIEQWLVETENR